MKTRDCKRPLAGAREGGVVTLMNRMSWLRHPTSSRGKPVIGGVDDGRALLHVQFDLRRTEAHILPFDEIEVDKVSGLITFSPGYRGSSRYSNVLLPVIATVPG